MHLNSKDRRKTITDHYAPLKIKKKIFRLTDLESCHDMLFFSFMWFGFNNRKIHLK